jgi:hypothetical protein
MKSIIAALAFILLTTSAQAGPKFKNVSLKQKQAVTCCCRIQGGGSCCAKQQMCMGNMVFGCMCSNFHHEEVLATRVSPRPLN